jgi:hypothetical protein
VPQGPSVPRLTIPALSSPYQKTPTEDPSDPWAVQHEQPAYKAQRHRSLLSRGIGTIKSLASPASASRYGALHDEPNDDRRGPHDDDEEHYDLGGVDISAFEGPFALQHMGATKNTLEETRIETRERLDSEASSSDSADGDLSQSRNNMLRVGTGSTILGGGMKVVLDAAPMDGEQTRQPPKSPTVDRSKSTLGRMRTMIQRGRSHRATSAVISEAEEQERAVHMEAQKAADEKGEILAVTGRLSWSLRLTGGDVLTFYRGGSGY